MASKNDKARKTASLSPLLIKIVAAYQRIFWAKREASLFSLRHLVHFGWEKNEKLKTLMSAGGPRNRKPVPKKDLKTNKCSFTS